MSSPIVADLFDLAAVRVSKYDYDPRLERAEVRFKIQSMKTKNYKYFSTVVKVTPEMKSGVGGMVAEVVTATAWNDVYTNHADKIVSFVTTETKTPSPYSSYVFTSVLPPIWDTPSVLGDFQVGNGLEVRLRARLSSSYVVSSGALPVGVDLNARTGELTGTPRVAGTYSFGVDAVGAAESLRTRRSFTLVTKDAPTWVVANGTTLSATGLLSGSTTGNGTFTFTLRTAGTDNAGETFTFAVELGPEWVTSSPLTSLEQGLFSSVQLIANDAAAYSVASGAPPAGMTVTATGFLEGTPTTRGSSTVTVRAISGSGAYTADRAFTVPVVVRPMWVTPATLPAAMSGAPYNEFLVATDGESYGTSDALPAGLALSVAGVLSGTPTTPGSYSFTVLATNDLSVTRQFNLTVA